MRLRNNDKNKEQDEQIIQGNAEQSRDYGEEDKNNG